MGTTVRWVRSTAARPGVRLAAMVLAVGLMGAVAGVLVGGRLSVPVGPVQTRFSVAPALTGDAVVAVPPLGSLTVDSHDGPLRLDVTVTRIDPEDARRILDNPSLIGGLPEEVTADVQAGLLRLVVRASIAAITGGLLLGLLVFRRAPPALLSAAVAGAALLLGGGAAVATWDPRAIVQPRYEGLLTIAPRVVGDARDIVGNFGRYQKQLAKIVTNVSRLYDVTSALPAYSPDPSTIRVLHVSDLHLNPAAWDVIRSIVEQFQVQVVVDTGDITDHGTSTEDRFVDPISRLGVPYVFVRGNHDSRGTERAVRSQRGAVVLASKAVTVAGLRFVGAGDPRFTPDKDTRETPGTTTLAQAGAALAARVLGTGAPRPDVVLVHDPEMGAPLDGAVPLVLAGHGHRREQRTLPGGTLLFEQGSTGGAGLRGLEGEEPTPIQAAVLYFDRDSHALRAWDDVTLGGLGLTSAQIERHLAAVPSAAPAGRRAPAVPARP